MDLVKRLFQVLRARLQISGDRRFENTRKWQRQTPHASKNTAATDSGRDPVLAGYYANLETPYGSDLATVRSAWKQMLQKYHPDLHSQDAQKRQIATELTQQLNRAYRELEKRLQQSSA